MRRVWNQTNNTFFGNFRCWTVKHVGKVWKFDLIFWWQKSSTCEKPATYERDTLYSIFLILKIFCLFSASETSTVSGTTVSSATSAVKRIELPKDKENDTSEDKKVETDEDNEITANSGEVGPEGEDTMKNLRKTFAGIFGDIA